MLLKKSMLKTKSFILKTLQNLRSFLFGGYEKIPRTLLLNPLSCSSIGQRSHQLDQIYSQNTNQSVPDHHQDNGNHMIEQIIDMVVPSTEAPTPNIPMNHSSGVLTSSCESMAKKEAGADQRKMEPTSSNCSSYRFQNGASYMLAQKMKELEMMDLSDVDHSLDVEEALHYYSRLTCPVYVDIVNKFFMDMYAEFLFPQPPISTISSSSQRLGPLTL